MSYVNLIVNNSENTGASALGNKNSSSNSPTKTMSKLTIFGITILTIYALTKILNFYDIGADKYGAYLLFYVFLILCASFLDMPHYKM
jgi:hypothetical protein